MLDYKNLKNACVIQDEFRGGTFYHTTGLTDNKLVFQATLELDLNTKTGMKLAYILSESEQMRIDENYRLKRKEVIYIE